MGASFQSKTEKMELPLPTRPPEFDKKYKIIIKHKHTLEYHKMLEWVDNNSNGAVEVKLGGELVITDAYFAFEDPDDALVFRIKYEI